MKTLFDLSWKVTEPEYRQDSAYSYSTLARFNREGFDNLESLGDKVETPSLTFGSMVDTLLTDGQEEFDKLFMPAEYPDCPDSIIQIVRDLFNEFCDTHNSIEDIPNIEIIGRASLHNYQNNWKPETRAKVIKEKGSAYYNLLYVAGDKKIVTTKEYNDACECVRILKESPVTKWYFEANNPFDNSIERFYQLKFKGEYNNIPLKCMADLIIIDSKNKTIIPCDLKTSGKKEWNFHHSFVQWNYWIQAQLYWYLIRCTLDKDEEYKDYKLDNYRFIVISNGSRTPLVWEYKDTTAIKDLYYGKNKQIICRNWRSIVEELDYYISSRPNVPIGIKETPNDIIEWLNKD